MSQVLLVLLHTKTHIDKAYLGKMYLDIAKM